MLLEDFQMIKRIITNGPDVDPEKSILKDEVVIRFFAKVIIRRNGKYYKVPVVRSLGSRVKEYNEYLFWETYDIFRDDCRMVYENHIITGIEEEWIPNIKHE